MKNFLSIAVFTVVLCLFYTGVGVILPNKPIEAPPDLKLGSNMPPQDLIDAAASVFEANCQQCHKIGRVERCPDLAGIGARATERASARAAATGQPYDDVDYFLESLCAPGDYLVEGFGNIMPPQSKALDPAAMIAMVAYMQDQGGTVTVSLADRDGMLDRLARFGCGSGDGGGALVAAAKPVGTPAETFQAFGCSGCHAIDRDRQPTDIGPSLQGAGSRMSKAYLYEALLEPDATLPEGDTPYPPGLMKATLDANGFYDRMTPGDYKALVEWLAHPEG